MKAIQLTETLQFYIESHCPSVSPVLAELAVETSKLPMGMMQISPDQGALMYFFAKLVNARRCVEIGCFTGYSAICVASALPDDGRLVTFDINRDTAQVAKRYFHKANLGQKIDLRLEPAEQGLAKLADEWGHSSVDMVFIDADKERQTLYYEAALELLRPGGLIVADNVLYSGQVANPAIETPNVVALRAFNQHVKNDTRVDRVLANLADGLFLARKR